MDHVTTIGETIQSLRRDLGDFLQRYEIPLDDRTFIVDRVEEAIGSILSIQKNIFEESLENIRREMDRDRQKVKNGIEALKEVALEKLEDLRGRIGEAYQRGISEGMKKADAVESSSGSRMLNIALALFFAALAFVVVAGNLFGGKSG